MHVLAVIPARYQSIRFPGKPLIDIRGQSMIKRVYNQVAKAQSVDEVKVATDDHQIYRHCMNEKIPVLMTSSSHQSGTDRVAEVAAISHADIVVNVQGDEPFMAPSDIDKLVGGLQGSNYSIATLAAPLIDLNRVPHSDLVKVVKRTDGRALYFSRSVIPFDRDETSARSFWHHLGIYAFMRPTLLEVASWPKGALENREKLEQLRWLEGGLEIVVVEVESTTMGIDSPSDLHALLHWMDENDVH